MGCCLQKCICWNSVWVNAVLLHKPRPRWLSPSSPWRPRRPTKQNVLAKCEQCAVFTFICFALWNSLVRFPCFTVLINLLYKKTKKPPKTKKHNNSVSQVCSVGRILALCKKGSVVTYLWETLESPSWWSRCMQSAAESWHWFNCI